MKHTPGPWLVEAPWSGCSAIRGPNNKLVFGLASGLPHEKQHDEICVANARLIAATPDLLDALENLLTAIDQFGLVGELDAGCDGEGPYETARAAVTKALGP